MIRLPDSLLQMAYGVEQRASQTSTDSRPAATTTKGAKRTRPNTSEGATAGAPESPFVVVLPAEEA